MGGNGRSENSGLLSVTIVDTTGIVEVGGWDGGLSVAGNSARISSFSAVDKDKPPPG
jgi:hypothetical protein